MKLKQNLKNQYPCFSVWEFKGWQQITKVEFSYFPVFSLSLSSAFSASIPVSKIFQRHWMRISGIQPCILSGGRAQWETKIKQGSLSIGAKLSTVLQAWWGNAKCNAWFSTNNKICNTLKTICKVWMCSGARCAPGWMCYTFLGLRNAMNSAIKIKKKKIFP